MRVFLVHETPDPEIAVCLVPKRRCESVSGSEFGARFPKRQSHVLTKLYQIQGKRRYLGSENPCSRFLPHRNVWYVSQVLASDSMSLYVMSL